MSHVVAIGLDPTAKTQALVEKLREVGFELGTANPLQGSDVVRETMEIAAELWPDAVWLIACQGPEADLDYVYRLASSLSSGDLRLLQDAGDSASIARIAFLLYDLGDPSLSKHAPESIQRMTQVLTYLYELGGPVASSYHEFRSDV